MAGAVYKEGGKGRVADSSRETIGTGGREWCQGMQDGKSIISND